MSDVWRVRLRIGANGSEYENAGIITDDPYAAIAEAIAGILPTVEVLQVARFTDTGAGWELVYGPEVLRHAELVTIPRSDLTVLLAAAAAVAGDQPVPELLRPLVAEVAKRYKVRLEVS